MMRGLGNLDLMYKTGCDCEFCKMNSATYQRLTRFIFGRYEHTVSLTRRTTNKVIYI